jgi:hypothetical protein
MERLFNQYKEKVVTHSNYSGIVCGYDDSRFILAVETNNDKGIFFRRLTKHDNAFILDEYKESKYRYVYEDERTILKQIRNNDNQNSTSNI